LITSIHTCIVLPLLGLNNLNFIVPPTVLSVKDIDAYIFDYSGRHAPPCNSFAMMTCKIGS